MPKSQIERARAKINLDLYIGKARKDGYHPLVSVVTFCETGLEDRLLISKAEGLSLEVSGPQAGAAGQGDDNLVMKAAVALARRAKDMPQKQDLGARLVLQKNIPVGAGLGGGSADAAAALRGLNKLWGLNLSSDELIQIGAPLGADIPSCIISKPLVMTGIGEKLSPLKLPKLKTLVVVPDVFMSTDRAYGRFDEAGLGRSEEELRALAFAMSKPFAKPAFENDLEEAALFLEPDIGHSLHMIKNETSALYAFMSGSGSACVGLYECEATLKKAAAYIRRRKERWGVYEGDTVS